ncbi:MAG: alanine racemase [Alphaproteobacteria bacterium]|nr:alanine racemase [Alphaproteobacteria bacterium]
MGSNDPTAAPTRLTIDLAALSANYRLLADRAKPARCAAVVKADAYGLGVAAAAPCLYDAGCRVFFVAHLVEGIELRALLDDPAVEIFVFNGLLPGEEDLFLQHRLCPALNDLGQIERWSAFGGRNGPQPAAIHLDTGMSRLGLPPQELDILAADPSKLDGVALRCIMSHLACADTPNHPLNREQLHAFRAALPRLPNTAASLAASSGIFLGPDYHFDLVRPGVALYGVAPVAGEPNPMQQVINLQGKIIQIRDVDAPRTVGYGATHQFAGPSRVATVAAGYADGYLRSLSGRGTAFIDDIAVPIVGRVSMDLITLDITKAPRAKLGDFVELIGPHHDADAVAREAGTIGYEILTALGRRYARHYTGNGR